MNRLLELNKKVKNKIKRKFSDFHVFCLFLKRYLGKQNTEVYTGKSVWLDIHDNYERHIYTLSKYFEIEGYRVYLKPNFRFLFSLGDRYAKRILKEDKTHFSFTKPTNSIAAFSDRKPGNDQLNFISKDYFSTIFNKDGNVYHIPIGLHPNMYQKGYWNKPVSISERKRFAFFAGDFNEAEYRKLNRKSKFKMLDRVSMMHLVQALPNAHFPKNFTELIDNAKSGQIDIVNRAVFQVPEEALRQTIAKYYFFIACPGFAMPLSHNVIEAMSVGTIPIIHWKYARMFHIELEDYRNAIIYDDHTFIDKLNEASKISAEKAQAMCENVLNYYNANLTPKAIVTHLLDKKHHTYFLKQRSSIRIMK